MKTEHLKIGQTAYDKEDRVTVHISGLTPSSVEIQHKKLTDKGIDCKQWYHIDNFNKRFVIQ